MPELTPISKRCSTSYFNWRLYFRDMYVSAVRASTGAFLAFAGSNTAESIAPVVLDGIGMNWRQAIAAAISALVFDVMRYINVNPLPKEVQEGTP